MVELDNIALVRRWFNEVWNQRRLETIDELLAPEARCFDMTAPDSIIVGPQSFRAAAAQMHAAFGEMQLTIEDIFASGDRVAVRLAYNALLLAVPAGLHFSPTRHVEIADALLHLVRLLHLVAVPQRHSPRAVLLVFYTSCPELTNVILALRGRLKRLASVLCHLGRFSCQAA